MRGLRSCWIALLLAGCNSPADRPAAATGEAAGGSEAAPMDESPATISLSDVAGTWAVRSTVEGDESTVVNYDLIADADRSGWSLKFPGRDPIPLRVVAVEGDSIVIEGGPFESVLRKGVQVRTVVVSRLQDGRLVGTTVARYEGQGPDSVARLRFEGTRKP